MLASLGRPGRTTALGVAKLAARLSGRSAGGRPSNRALEPVAEDHHQTRGPTAEAVKGRFLAAIGEPVGRRVQALMSSRSEPEPSAEIFVLEPSDSER